MSMRFLSRAEEIILLSIWKLQDNAYGIEIMNQVSEASGKKWSIGAVYAPLTRLVEKKYLRTFEGESSPERGGRRKVYYELTDDGIRELEKVKQVHDNIWKNIPAFNS